MTAMNVVFKLLFKEYKTPNEKIGNNVTLCNGQVILG